MTEKTGQQQYRTCVRGSCVSYHMPWEDVLEQLQKHGDDRTAATLPRPQECLKYMLRLHLQVNGLDFAKHLRQVQVRPYVLIALLDFLIDTNHESFRGKGTAASLKEERERECEPMYRVSIRRKMSFLHPYWPCSRLPTRNSHKRRGEHP